MKTPSNFDQEIASRFDETRPIEPAQCQKAFRPALNVIAQSSKPRILDLGCGTGRLLECLISELPTSSIVVGVDESEPMLVEARKKVCFVKTGVKFIRESLFCYEHSSDYEGPFDLVICHWLFHTVPEWQAAVVAAARMVKENGILVWMSEDGDLYEALDEVRERDHWAPIDRLFHVYHQSVAAKVENFNPVARAGTLLRNSKALLKLLNQCGWDVSEDNAHLVKWLVNDKTVQWVIDHIIKLRVFTNLRVVSPEHHNAAIEELEKALGQGQVPKADSRLTLNFRAHLHRGHRDKWVADFDRAAASILQVAGEMRSYGLHYHYDETNGATAEIGKTLRPFLDSLLLGDLSPLWSSFWSREATNRPSPSDRPLWAWVRIWEADQTFEKFLKNIVYRFRQPSTPAWSNNILKAYFESTVPFLSLARHSEAEFEPVEVLRGCGAAQPTCSASHPELSSTQPPDFTASGRNMVRINLSQAFFAPDSGVCPVVNDADFEPQAWKIACGEWLRNINRAENPGLRAKRAALEQLGRELDSLLLQKRFSGPHGLKNIIAFIQAISLFPGKAFYLFPVPRLKGGVGAALTLACEQPLNDVQIFTLQQITEALFLLPSIVASAGKQFSGQK